MSTEQNPCATLDILGDAHLASASNLSAYFSKLWNSSEIRVISAPESKWRSTVSFLRDSTHPRTDSTDIPMAESPGFGFLFFGSIMLSSSTGGGGKGSSLFSSSSSSVTGSLSSSWSLQSFSSLMTWHLALGILASFSQLFSLFGENGLVPNISVVLCVFGLILYDGCLQDFLDVLGSRLTHKDRWESWIRRSISTEYAL
ncbi:hypothetical protein C8R44DRAFT_863763 [Mycena epipterygia]|nr:hypothetical protein C8R44DRAFT_863763 [Mycena epipterygia]